MRTPNESFFKLLANYPDDFYSFIHCITTPMISEVFFQCYGSSGKPSSAVIPLDIDADYYKLLAFLSGTDLILSITETKELLEFIYKNGLLVLAKYLSDNGHPANGRHFKIFVNIPEEGAVIFAPDEFIKIASALFHKGGVDSIMKYVYGE